MKNNSTKSNTNFIFKHCIFCINYLIFLCKKTFWEHFSTDLKLLSKKKNFKNDIVNIFSNGYKLTKKTITAYYDKKIKFNFTQVTKSYYFSKYNSIKMCKKRY